jgi:hypothetical protein
MRALSIKLSVLDLEMKFRLFFDIGQRRHKPGGVSAAIAEILNVMGSMGLQV